MNKNEAGNEHTIAAFSQMAKDAQNLRLEPVKKSAIRSHIMLAMDDASTATAAESVQPAGFIYFRKRIIPYAIASLAVLLVVTIGGVSLAAQDALPGNPLYPVKTQVNEKIAGMFISSPQAKAEYNISLASQRLQELEQVTANHQLNAQASAQVQALLNEHVADAQQEIGDLRKTGADSESLEDDSLLEATLQGHAQVLNQLDSKSLTGVISDVQEQADQVSKDRQTDESKTADNNSPHIKAGVQKAMDQVKNQLQKITADISHETAAHNTDYQSLLNDITQVTSQIDNGNSQLSSGNYGQALVSIQSALRNMQELQTYLSQQQQLKLNINVPALLPEQTDKNADQAISLPGASISPEASINVFENNDNNHNKHN